MNDPIHFHLVVDLTVIARDDIDTVGEALAKMRGICLAEPGCLRWEALQATESPEKFFLVEAWETRDHWEAHGELSAIRDSSSLWCCRGSNGSCSRLPGNLGSPAAPTAGSELMPADPAAKWS